ncbi:MAG: hypothetical protein JWO30_2404 [Fibrobacteres bacterium]|nr:hypothetical protein [Fibrobacterota bacterium]
MGIALFRTLPALAALLLAACFGTDPDGSFTPGGLSRDLGTYSVSGDKIITDRGIDSIGYCNRDSLTIRIDSTRFDTSRFQLKGDSLYLFQDSGSLDSAEVISRWSLARMGSGTGLTGVWMLIATEDILLSGVFTQQEKDQQARSRAVQAANHSEFPLYFRYDGSRLTVFGSDESAKLFISVWNRGNGYDSIPDGSRYDIALSVLDKKTVGLQGRISGEKVRIVLDYDERACEIRTYSSDNPAHATQVYNPRPRTCPNPYEPQWYLDFLGANTKP